jgi:uncharacterized protein YoxC
MTFCYGLKRSRSVAICLTLRAGAVQEGRDGRFSERRPALEITLLTILYGVLIVAVVAVGALLAVVLWQASVLIAQARTVFIPQVQALLVEAQQNLKNTEDITADVNGKLEKLDGAIDAANTAVQSIGQTTLLVNKAVAQPLVLNTAAFLAGVKSAAAYLRDHRKDRRPAQTVGVRTEGLRTELKAEKVRS